MGMVAKGKGGGTRLSACRDSVPKTLWGQRPLKAKKARMVCVSDETSTRGDRSGGLADSVLADTRTIDAIA